MAQGWCFFILPSITHVVYPEFHLMELLKPRLLNCTVCQETLQSQKDTALLHTVLVSMQLALSCMHYADTGKASRAQYRDVNNTACFLVG